MTMYKPPRRPQFFYTTAPLPCPYLAGRTERKVVTEIVGPDAEALHDRLSRAASAAATTSPMRRCARPARPACRSAYPWTLPAGSHAAQNPPGERALEGYHVPARATAEQFQLFQRYQQVRHGDGDMAA